jgi:hypothetical protein
MPRNGSGTYSRVPGSAYTNDTVADGTEIDAEMDDIATALTNSLAANGEKAMTGPLNLGGNGILSGGQASFTRVTAGSLGFLGAAGSASTPTYGFSGDGQSGMYQPATYSIAFATSGVRAMHIDSSQRIGIGNGSPQERLHVSGSIRVEQTANAAVNLHGNGALVGGISADSASYAVTVSANSATNGNVSVVVGSTTLAKAIGGTAVGPALYLGNPANTYDSISGFAQLRTHNAAPGATPLQTSGWSPLYVDSANNRLYICINGTWRYAALT